MELNDLESAKKERIGWIDIARGIGIFLIVVAHVKNTGHIREMITYSVPFFFYLTGLTFHKKENTKEFIISKIKTLYIPYIIVGLISIFIYLLLGRYIGENVGFNAKDIFKNLFGLAYANAGLNNMMWNRPLWFICVYLVTIIICNFIEKIKNIHIKNLVVIVCTAIRNAITYF